MKKILFILIFIYSNITFAGPAYPGEIEFHQTDGSSFKGYLKGDEWFNWIEDSNNRTVLKYNKNSKNYENAIVQNINGVAELVPSGIKFAPMLKRNLKNSLSNEGLMNKSSPNTLNSTTSTTQNTLSDIWQRKRNNALKHMRQNYR